MNDMICVCLCSDRAMNIVLSMVWEMCRHHIIDREFQITLWYNSSFATELHPYVGLALNPIYIAYLSQSVFYENPHGSVRAYPRRMESVFEKKNIMG